jgi:hypothetical protein
LQVEEKSNGFKPLVVRRRNFMHAIEKTNMFLKTISPPTKFCNTTCEIPSQY